MKKTHSINTVHKFPPPPKEIYSKILVFNFFDRTQ